MYVYYTIVLTRAMIEGAKNEPFISVESVLYIRCNFDISYFHAASFLASGFFR
jgi:hypothetical protein